MARAKKKEWSHHEVDRSTGSGAMESVFIRVICGLQLLCDGAMASSIQHPAPEFPAASVT